MTITIYLPPSIHSLDYIFYCDLKTNKTNIYCLKLIQYILYFHQIYCIEILQIEIQ